MTAARKPKVPRGYRLVTRGKVREGDLLWVNARQEWSGPIEWNGVLALGADHEIPCNENCKVSRPAARGRDGKGRK